MIDKTPPGRPDEPGIGGTYGQGDFVQSAQRSRLHKDQHYAPKTSGSPEVPDPYGEGGYAGGEGQGGARQSGYGVDYGQLKGAELNETHVTEERMRKAGTADKSIR